MSETPRLKLPCIAAAQAQKHVTHNEALMDLDVFVQPLVRDKDLSAPPGAPGQGDIYIVADGASGAWAGHVGKLAASIDGAWRFVAPFDGLVAWLEDEATQYVYHAGAWHSFAALMSLQNVPMVGINTLADTTNRLAVKSNALLFASLEQAAGGDGDIQFKVTKEAAQHTASLLFQSGYSGRAEFGLTGDDDLHLKMSADGQVWLDALSVDHADATLTVHRGLRDGDGLAVAVLPNLVTNADARVNQRGFAGGALAPGAYAYDRWKAGSSGCTVDVVSGVWTLTGDLQQVLEDPQLRDRVVTVSLQDPSGDVEVTLGSASATIQAGAGCRFATLALGAGDIGDLVLQLSCAAATGFARPRLDYGAFPGPHHRPEPALEIAVCQRFYVNQSFESIWSGRAATGGYYYKDVYFPVTMRANPLVTALDGPSNNVGFADGAPAVSQSSAEGFLVNKQATATGENSYFTFIWTASAEL